MSKERKLRTLGSQGEDYIPPRWKRLRTRKAERKEAVKRELKRREGKHPVLFRGTTHYINPVGVKGRKVKGGRAVTLRNFTGTIVKKSDGTVGILGRGRRK